MLMHGKFSYPEYMSLWFQSCLHGCSDQASASAAGNGKKKHAGGKNSLEAVKFWCQTS